MTKPISHQRGICKECFSPEPNVYFCFPQPEKKYDEPCVITDSLQCPTYMALNADHTTCNKCEQLIRILSEALKKATKEVT